MTGVQTCALPISMVKFDLARWPSLVDYQKRVGARPKVQEALKAEGLVK